MRKRLSAFILCAAIVLSLMPSGVFAAESYGNVPILIGYADVDYVAEQILAEIPTAGKSASGQIQAVYDWIVANCKRSGWDGTYYVDEQAVQVAAQEYGQTMQNQIDAGKAVIRTEMENYWMTEGESGGTFSIDSNIYVAHMAWNMMLTRTGDCTNFSGLFIVLLGHLGYDCRMIGGDFINNDGSHVMHKWNYALVDGQYYWFDVRMDHAAVSWYGYNPHEYFMIADTAVWETDHDWDHSYSNLLAANPQTVIDVYNQVLQAAANPSGSYTPVDTSYGNLANYKKINTYKEGQFHDVNAGDWYAENVQRAFEYGLVLGYGDGNFGVGANLTIAQTLAIADRLHNIYYGGTGVFEQGDPWYQVYVDYAVKYNIVSPDQYDPLATATRAQFAMILSSALPDAALPAINNISGIPDIYASQMYYGDVYRLYNAGILTGNDEYGTFAPDSPISREQVAAMAARFADPTQRKKYSLKTSNPEISWLRIDENMGVENYGEIDYLNTKWFKIALPAALPWICISSEDGLSLTFYYEPSYEKDDGYDGRFLTICAFDHDNLSYEYYPQYCVAIKDRYKTYVAIYPSDVRVNPDDSVAQEEYGYLLSWAYLLDSENPPFEVLYP